MPAIIICCDPSGGGRICFLYNKTIYTCHLLYATVNIAGRSGGGRGASGRGEEYLRMMMR